MLSIPYQHIPVMADEAIGFLNIKPGKVYVDCTLGGGGHLERSQTPDPGSHFICFDQDIDAINAAKARLAKYNNITYINDNFSNIKKHLHQKVDGILFDLGVSSYQIDEPSRGFSIKSDGPLDMRMDKNTSLTAEEIINTYSLGELLKIFNEYGEERFAKKIADRIIKLRESSPIKTTFELKQIIEEAIPTWKKRESVSRIFQALRIAVNSELDSLQIALNDSIDLLNPGGRVVVLSYHSLEDRIVKHAFRDLSKNGILKLLTKKPVLANASEIELNSRSRSAKLRAAEKL